MTKTFVAVGSAVPRATTDSLIQSSVYPLRGDIDGDGLFEAVVWARPDDAGNCDGLPRNNVAVGLQGATGTSSDLRCCGP